MEATGRKVVRLTAGGASAILGVNMSGFAIETAAPQAPVSPTPPTIEPLTIDAASACGVTIPSAPSPASHYSVRPRISNAQRFPVGVIS